MQERAAASLFAGYVSNLMMLFAMQRMPLRGAIGFGDYTYTSNPKIFLSDIFKRLSHAEREQEWAGCVVLPQFEDQFVSELFDSGVPEPRRSCLLLRYPVPLKNDRIQTAWCLNWLDFHLNRRYRQHLRATMAGDPTKWQNTEKFLQYFETLPDNRMSLPAEFLPATFASIIKQIRVQDLTFGVALESTFNPSACGCTSRA